ncbi:expressed unknown protein [Seminavis robusta]|uniref:Uncharacterized protein n=1 Tax=Seminavis robusta TaxID=568900 RepID=A0A9N8HBB7_9STRA|nr:expressed unknown protein [Seminavis robusta]|eukprot:Sro177_g077730.1 n/a (303) ;mRNA; f:36609-37517
MVPKESSHSNLHPEEDDDDCLIRYFSYGAMCNPTSRGRRSLTSVNQQPAMLVGYTLVFSNGTGNVIRQTTKSQEEQPTVYGVLMEFHSLKDWDIVVKSESGYRYDVMEADVVPYRMVNSTTMKEEPPIKARFFQFPGTELDAKEKLPSERYLRIVSLGLTHHGVHPRYTQWWKSRPSQPTVEPEDYQTFPTNSCLLLPTISRPEFLERSRKEHLFVMHRTKVIQMLTTTQDNCCAVWLHENAIGKAECLSWGIFLQLYEPNLPPCTTRQDLQEIHHQWAEHELTSFAQGCHCRLEHVMNLSI